MGITKEEVKELKEQNKELRKLVALYNQGKSNIVMCSKCNIPLKTEENRIRVVLNKRMDSKGNYNYSDKQIGVFHIKCWEKTPKT
jgi:hypothetical protein